MKGKLIKTDVNYILEDNKGVVIASTSLKKEGLSLSLKNCQAVELGYDLDELADEYAHKTCEDMYEQKVLQVLSGDGKQLLILKKASKNVWS